MLAELGLGDGGEHARGDVPRAGLARVEHERRAAPRWAARHAHGEADRPAADDGDVEAARTAMTLRYALPTPARPGSGSTVGGPVPPSQPDSRAPVFWTSMVAARLVA